MVIRRTPEKLDTVLEKLEMAGLKINPFKSCLHNNQKKILAIVATLKEFKNILLGEIINVCTDH